MTAKIILGDTLNAYLCRNDAIDRAFRHPMCQSKAAPMGRCFPSALLDLRCLSCHRLHRQRVPVFPTNCEDTNEERESTTAQRCVLSRILAMQSSCYTFGFLCSVNGQSYLSDPLPHLV